MMLFLYEAITDNLSLNDIKLKISQFKNNTSTDYSNLSTDELIKDLRQSYQKFSRSKKIWSNQKNRKKIEALLKQIKNLFDDEAVFDFLTRGLPSFSALSDGDDKIARNIEIVALLR